MTETEHKLAQATIKQFGSIWHKYTSIRSEIIRLLHAGAWNDIPVCDHGDPEQYALALLAHLRNINNSFAEVASKCLEAMGYMGQIALAEADQGEADDKIPHSYINETFTLPRPGDKSAD